MQYFYLFIFTFVLGLGGALIQKAAVVTEEFTLPESQYGLLGSLFAPGTALFGGDIMLGRSVEGVMSEKGMEFPFEKIREVIGKHDLSVGNFEASIPEVHKRTPPNTMRFSVTEDALKATASAGFDILSLANNHALDYGEEGYLHTQDACNSIAITCAGHPVKLDSNSYTVARVGQTRVGILMLHTLFQSPATTSLAALIDKLEDISDVQYVFVHWGDEYEPIHNDTQESLAYFLIDEGVDGVIGHHPHVIQDIELYRDKPIFYSLGNLIFDQYFSKEVQEGYMVSTVFNKNDVAFTLIPYDTHDVRSQPGLQEGGVRKATLQTLLKPVYFSDIEIEMGSFQVKRD